MSHGSKGGRMYIGKLCKKSDKAVSRDIKIFSRWAKGEISTEEAIIEFKISNRCEREEITEDAFVLWLESLGWKRHGRSKKTYL